jgi:acylpyruvate hydrolase
VYDVTAVKILPPVMPATMLAYVSNIMTLRPGDIIATGTPAGMGSARTPPVYFKPGDRSVCTTKALGP